MWLCEYCESIQAQILQTSKLGVTHSTVLAQLYFFWTFPSNLITVRASCVQGFTVSKTQLKFDVTLNPYNK